MQHPDHVALLRDGVMPDVWADLGSGDGAFTLAAQVGLAEPRLLGRVPSRYLDSIYSAVNLAR